jgi:hypothetical protein
MAVSDVALLAAISAAFIVLKNVTKKREKYRGSKWVKGYLKSRNSRIMRDLEFKEDVLFNNFTFMSETFMRFWGIVAANDYKTEYYCYVMRYCFQQRSKYLRHAL